MSASYHADDLDPILSLIRRIAKAERVEVFLKKAKGVNSEIKSTGGLDELVFQSLREAVRSGAATVGDVLGLLFDAEESGQQNIFLFRPKVVADGVAVRLGDPESVAATLFGPNWRDDRGFPLVLDRHTGERWADFRLGPSGSLGTAWTAKLYSGKYRWESLGKVPKDSETLIETWKQRLSRDVLLVRWHVAGILEMRVPQEPSRKELLASLDGLWQAIGHVTRESEFDRLNLNPACMKLIDNHEFYNDICRLGDSRVQDQQGGIARFSPPSGRDHLMSDVTREQAIKLYKLCNELVVTWFLDREKHDTQDSLRTTIGKLGPHHIHIRAKTSGKAIEHVTEQLRRLL